MSQERLGTTASEQTIACERIQSDGSVPGSDAAAPSPETRRICLGKTASLAS